MKRGLIVDIVFPNKYSLWRYHCIKNLLDHFETDILVFKTDSFSNVDYNFDYEYFKEEFKLPNYNLFILNPKYKNLTKYVPHQKIDPLKYLGTGGGSYIFTKSDSLDFTQYDFVYSTFLQLYKLFNSRYKFPYERQICHLYPGGGFALRTSDLEGVSKESAYITTNPLTARMLAELHFKKRLDLDINCFLGEGEVLKPKTHQGDLNVCFGSLGDLKSKGWFEYVNVAEHYKRIYPDDRVNFYAIGNIPQHPNIICKTPVGFRKLLKFYENINVYCSFVRATTFNGWPLGVEAIIKGSALITTDPHNLGSHYRLPLNSIVIYKTVEETVQQLKRFYGDPNLLYKYVKNTQNFLYPYIKYKNQQLKIKRFIENTF